MPKNRNKKRDENHNRKVVPVKKMSAHNVSSVNNLPVKNLSTDKLPIDNVIKNDLPIDNVPKNDLPIENVSKENVPVNNVPINNEPTNNVPTNDLPVKHPLNSKWTLWYYLPDKSKDWESCQHKIHSVDTVEDFWSFVDHLTPPSELGSGVDFSFFKNDIRPMWEAPQNVKGGRLTVINTSKSRNVDINSIWLDILLFLIGEYYEYSEDICGVVLNVRNYGIKMAIWTRHQDKERLKSIGSNLRQSMSSPLNHQIPFEVHAETQRSAQTLGRASSKNVFSV